MNFIFRPRPISEEAKRVVLSLRERPEKWSQSCKYWVKHPSGVKIWVANEAYGTALGFGESRPGDWDSDDSQSKAAIWKAYESWKKNHKVTTKIIEALNGYEGDPSVADQ